MTSYYTDSGVVICVGRPHLSAVKKSYSCFANTLFTVCLCAKVCWKTFVLLCQVLLVYFIYFPFLKNIFLYIVTMSLCYSCSPEYTYKCVEPEGGCTLKLWKTDRFTYIDSRGQYKFISKGDYKLSDSTLLLTYRYDDELPVGHDYPKYEIISDLKDPSRCEITVREAHQQDVLPFCTVACMTGENRIISGWETDKDGNASFVIPEKADHLVFQYFNMADISLDIDLIAGKRSIIHLPQFKKRGGRMRGACFPEYIDYILEYQVAGDQLICRDKQLLLVR